MSAGTVGLQRQSIPTRLEPEIQILSVKQIPIPCVTRPLGWLGRLSCKSSVFWLTLNTQTQRTEAHLNANTQMTCFFLGGAMHSKPHTEFQETHLEIEREKKKTSEKCFCLILHIFNAGDLCNMQSHLFLYNI